MKCEKCEMEKKLWKTKIGMKDVPKERFNEIMSFLNDNPEELQIEPKCPHCQSSKIKIEKVDFVQVIKGIGDQYEELKIYDDFRPLGSEVDVTIVCEDCNEKIYGCYELNFISYTTKDNEEYDANVNQISDDWALPKNERWEITTFE